MSHNISIPTNPEQSWIENPTGLKPMHVLDIEVYNKSAIITGRSKKGSLLRGVIGITRQELSKLASALLPYTNDVIIHGYRLWDSDKHAYIGEGTAWNQTLNTTALFQTKEEAHDYLCDLLETGKGETKDGDKTLSLEQLCSLYNYKVQEVMEWSVM